MYENVELLTQFYDLDDISGELDLWCNMWMKKNLPKNISKDIQVVDVFKDVNSFFPVMTDALTIRSTILQTIL